MTAPVGSVIMPSTRIPLTQVFCADTKDGASSITTAAIPFIHFLRMSRFISRYEHPRDGSYIPMFCNEDPV
jgi:hypothetical protein